MGKISFDFTGNNFLVVGGTKGIGRAITEELLKAGATVAVVYNSDDAIAREAETYFKTIAHEENSCIVAKCDVTNPICRLRLRDLIVEKFPTKWLDGIVYCPGLDKPADIYRVEYEDMQQIMTTNALALPLLVKDMIPLLKESFNRTCEGLSDINPCVLAFSSRLAESPEADSLAYSMSKGALQVAIRYLNRTFKGSIRAAYVVPYLTLTDTVKSIYDDKDLEEMAASSLNKRLASPEDILAVLGFLSGETPYENIHIDGGEAVYNESMAKF